MRTQARQGANWVARHEPLAVLLMAPWLLFPEASQSLTIGALVALPLLWLLRSIAGRPLSINTPLNTPLLLLLMALGAAVWVSPVPALSIPRATTLLLGVGLFFALVNCDPGWRRPEMGAMVLTAAAAALVLLALVGIDWESGQSGLMGGIRDQLSRLSAAAPDSFSGALDPGEVGGTLALLLPVVISFALLARRQGRQPLMNHWQALAWSSACLAVLMALLLLLTGSRTAIVVTVLVGGLVGAVRRRGLGVVMLGIAVVGCILLLIGLLSGSLSGWMASLDTIGQPPGTPPTAWLEREETWRNAVYAIRDYPVVGSGLGAFAPLAWLNYGFDSLAYDASLDHVSNLWLQAGVDMGLMGLFAFGWMTLVLLPLGWTVQRRRQTDDRIVLAGMWLGLVAWLAHGMVDAVPLGTWPALAVWAMMGLLVAAWSGERASNVLEVQEERVRRNGWRPLILAATVVLVAAWVGRSPVWALNRGANLLDAALLGEEQGDLAEALALVNAAAADAPSLPGTLRRRALAYYESGERAEAIRLFRQDDEAERFLVSRTRWLLAEGSLAQAMDLLHVGLDVAPGSGRLTCLMGDAYRSAGSTSEALRFYSRVPEMAASFGEETVILAGCYYRLGLLEKRFGRWSRAADSFGAAAALDPGVIPYQADYGWALFQATGELSQAVMIEEADLELEPGAVDVIMILADIYLQADRPKKGLEWSQNAVEAAPTVPEAWLRLAQAHWLSGQWEEARQALAEVLRLDPENQAGAELQAEWGSP
ncbi:MAG: tetratricopeptide repeat protein [Ardenticatenales bacterium]|nr:tetratricopeptide repeat protein [Ardenticatenales bacterium]